MTLPQFQIQFDPLPNPEAVVSGENVRFTVLTDRLIRMEYSPSGEFEDRASQAIWYRNQPVPFYDLVANQERIEIETEHLHLLLPHQFPRIYIQPPCRLSSKRPGIPGITATILTGLATWAAPTVPWTKQQVLCVPTPA